MNTQKLREIVEARVDEHEKFRAKTNARLKTKTDDHETIGLLKMALMCSTSETDFLSILLKEMVDS